MPILSDLEKAQKLALNAFKASSSTQRTKLAQRSLRLSKDCADAYTVLAEEADCLKESMELYIHALKIGKRAIGS